MNGRQWWLVPILGTAALFWLLHGELLFGPNTPSSYDLTGHLYPTAQLVSRLLPGGRVHGWSAQWFAGVPLFYFYFPLPGMIVASFTPMLGIVPAFKLTAALGVLAFPVATYVLYRALPVTPAQAAAGSLVGATFLLMQSYLFLGGNIASMLAGEFAYSISLTLSLFYLAAVLRASGSVQAAALSACLLAAVALSHTVPTIVIVLVTAMLLLDPARRRVILASWILGFLLTAFWSLPFLLRSGEIATVFTDAVRSWREAMPTELWPVLPLAVAGAITIRNDRRAMPFALLAVAGLIGFALAGRFVYPGRFLPFWFLGIHLLAGYAVCGWLESFRSTTRNQTATIAIGAAVLVFVGMNIVRGTGVLRDWAGATFAGLETTSTWPEVRSVMHHLRGTPGRVYWEQAPRELAALGSRNLAAATPWFADGRAVVNGLWHESSQIGEELEEIDAAFELVAQGSTEDSDSILGDALARLRALGVTQVVALRANTARALSGINGAAVEFGTPRMAVFRIPGDRLVSSDSPDARIHVSEWSDERIRFETDAIGVPHVIRMSWFPNWKASGASKPERVHGSFMSVIPASNTVELVFARTWVENVATAATAAGFLAVATLLALAASRRKDP